MTKYFRNLTQKKVKEVSPRDADTISKEYTLVRAKAGDCQYQIYVHETALTNLNMQLQRLSTEYAKRLELDKLLAPIKEEKVSNERA